MTGIQLVKDNCMGWMTPKIPPQFETIKSYIFSCTLINRVTDNWKNILMDCSTIIAVTGFVVALINGSPFLCVTFAIITISSGVGSFYMRRFAELKSMESTVSGLKETGVKFENLAKNLETENSRLAQTNRDLVQTNVAFRVTNQDLQTTNANFRTTNTQLTHQVTNLTLQVTQLGQSSERIKQEVIQFQQNNSHLGANVQGLDQSMKVLDEQILNSRALCSQITTHLSTQQEGLGQQIEQLGRYLTELRSQGAVHQKIQDLEALQKQAQQTTTQLHETQLKLTEERAKFDTIHIALTQLKEKFDTSMNQGMQNFNNNNQEFRNSLVGLQKLLNNQPSTPV